MPPFPVRRASQAISTAQLSLRRRVPPVVPGAHYHQRMLSLRFIGRVIRRLAKRPGLVVEAARTGVALAPVRWWRRPPFVPRPDRAYLAWRTATAYGRADAPLDVDDVVAFLEWRKRQRAVRTSQRPVRGV